MFKKNLSVLFLSHFSLHFTLYVVSVSFSNIVSLSKNCVFQRRSCTRTTRRRPYIMIRTRMPIPENPNLITALWCSTDPYAPPGASSVWSDITHTYTQLYLSLFPLYIQCTDKYTVISAVKDWNASVFGHPLMENRTGINMGTW